MEPLLSWKTPEYIEHKKGADWYWWLSLVAVGLLIFSAYEHSLLFGVFVVLGWFTIMLYSARAPEVVKIVISANGVAVKNNLYPWTNIKSFWVFEKIYKKEISLELNRAFMPYLKIPLGDVDPAKAREVISKFTAEKEHQESLIDNLSDIAKF